MGETYIVPGTVYYCERNKILSLMELAFYHLVKLNMTIL